MQPYLYNTYEHEYHGYEYEYENNLPSIYFHILLYEYAIKFSRTK